MVVDEVRNQPRSSRRLWIAHRLVPIEHRGIAGIGVDVGIQMREVSLAHNEVRNAVSIDIGEGRSV